MKRWVAFLGLGTLVGFVFVSHTQLGQQPDGSFIVSNGQRIELLGKTTRLEGVRPKDMALSPNKELVAILTHARLLVSEPSGKALAEINLSAGPLGLAWSPDGKTIYCSLASGKVGVFGWTGSVLNKTTEWSVLPSNAKGNPGTTGLVTSANGTVFAALSIRNQVVAISPAGEILATWNVGACPYNLALSSDGKTLAVANRGGTIIAPSPEQGDPTTRMAFQGTGVASAESAGTSVQIDPRTDAALVGTITLISTDSPAGNTKSVTVGRQPSGMSFSPDGSLLYIADSDEDCVSVVDPIASKEIKRISITPKEDSTFGQIPTSLALSGDGKLLYASLGGANSVAVLDVANNLSVKGYVPTAWYPISILATQNQLLVGCSKGVGSRPISKTTGFGVHDSVGVYQVFNLNEIQDLRKLSRIVAKNNGWTKTLAPRSNQKPLPVPERVGEPSVFTHVVYIIKENLTYDIAMGDIKDGNGDPSLCTFPQNVTPNHHALAQRFGLFDNFYISGTNSADGHQWVDSSIANDYTERNYGANQRSYPYDGGDPLAYSPAGFLWSQARASGKTVRVFGEFVNKPSIIDSKTGKTPDWRRCWEDYKSGKGEVLITAGSSQATLRESLDPNYIGFPVTVTDQWRADRFINQLNKWEGTDSMPNLSILLLPNDHTGGTRPNWPTPRAEVADNDFALGRLVEALSKSKFWPTTLIIVAEDDSQNGLDHVDGHRSICFCISAYSRPGTNSDMFNHSSITSTIGHVLGMPPMTRFDRTIHPMRSCFSDKPNLAPYQAAPNQVPLDELNPPLKKNQSAEARRLAEACAKMDWDEPDTQDQETLNRAIWIKEAPRSVGRAGYSTEYPSIAKR